MNEAIYCRIGVSNAGEGSDRPAARSDCKIEKTFGGIKTWGDGVVE
jgi:hypothetical protein